MAGASLALLTALLPFACLARSAKVQIDSMKHDIALITPANFDGVISKFRDSQVAAVWMFKASSSEDAAFLDEYNKVATDLKSMVKVTAIDCDEYSVWCKKQGMTKTPTVMMYPTMPMPAFAHEGKMDSKAITAKLAKFIPDYTQVITSEKIDEFLTTTPDKPKVILFSNKPKPPMIFKALSSEMVFKRTIKFGFATESDAAVCKQMKVTKFPTLMMIRGAKADKKEIYSGEMNFISIKDWVNLYSESGSGFTTHSGGKEAETMEEAKPWLVQEIPELTGKSHQDICFKGEGLCVIYLADGKAKPEEIDMLSRLSKKFTSQLSDRGAKMKWMWIDMQVEVQFKGLFDPAMLPSAVVFNPHKRLRFAKLDHGEDNEVVGNEASLANLMDKVLGGDARFKMVPGQKLPGWATRDAKKTEL